MEWEAVKIYGMLPLSKQPFSGDTFQGDRNLKYKEETKKKTCELCVEENKTLPQYVCERSNRLILSRNVYLFPVGSFLLTAR